MADDGVLLVRSKWLAGFLASLGCVEREPSTETHDGEKVWQTFYFSPHQPIKIGVVIAAWEANANNSVPELIKKIEYQTNKSEVEKGQELELVELTSIHYCALTNANRFAKAAIINQKLVLRKGGEVKAILPAQYGPATAQKYGLPYPPKHLPTKQHHN
jgi:hypothetical protein